MSRVNGHTVEQVIESVRKNHGILAAVARDLGVDRRTVYRYVHVYATIAQAVEDERESLIDLAENQLYKAVAKGSIPAIMFTLKTVGRTRGYVERQEVTTPEDAPIKIVVEYADDTTPEIAPPSQGAKGD